MKELIIKIINEASPTVQKPTKRIMANPEMRQWVTENTLGGDSDAERIYTALYGKPTCKYGNSHRFQYLTTGYIGCGKAGYSPGACICAMDKKVATNIAKFGESHPMKTQLIKERLGESNLEKYGVRNPAQNEEVRERMRQTCISRYGTNDFTTTDLYKQKVKETNIKKYGVIHKNQLQLSSELLAVLQDKDQLIEALKGHTFNSLAKQVGCNRSTIEKYAFKHGLPKQWSNVSSHERAIQTALVESGIAFIHSDRKTIKPYEIDIYVPSVNLGIEFNGIYWHSEQFKIKTYHADKYQLALSKGVRLIQIFEDEWISSQHTVLEKISSLISEVKKLSPGETVEVDNRWPIAIDTNTVDFIEVVPPQIYCYSKQFPVWDAGKTIYKRQ